MKNLKHLVLTVLVALVSCLSASAYDFIYNDLCYKIASETTCWVTYKKYLDKSYSGDINIPSTVTYSGKTYTVVGIEYCTFWGCEDLTSISIPNTVTYISGSAFFNCNKLSSIVIPNGVTNIEDCAFAHCSSLVSVNIPAGVKNVGPNVFYNCTSLPVENNVRYADTYAVEAVDKGIYSCILREGTKYIGDGAFKDCDKLSAVFIPNTVSSIREDAFYGCINLREIISMNTTPPTIYNNSYGGTFYDVDLENCVVKVPSEALTSYKDANFWKDFTHIQAIVESTQLDDAVPYTRKFDKENTTVTYIRNFESTSWQPLYVPFEMKYEDWAPYAEVAYINNVHQWDDDRDGTIDRTVLEFITKTSGAIEANKPYVIRPKQKGEVTFTTENTMLYAAPETDGYVDCMSTTTKYTLYGTYTEKTDMYENGYYGMSDGNFKYANTPSVTLSPFRTYLKIESRSGSGPVQAAPKRISVIVDGVIDESTAINGVLSTEGRKQGETYNLSGQKVSSDFRGLVIKNGKKVAIK